MVAFFQKTPAYSVDTLWCGGLKYNFFGLQNFIFWAQGGLFSDLFVFSKFTESFQNLLSSLYQWEKLTTQPLHLYQIYRVFTE